MGGAGGFVGHTFDKGATIYYDLFCVWWWPPFFSQRVDYMNKVLCPYWSAGITAAKRDSYARKSLQELMDLDNL